METLKDYIRSKLLKTINFDDFMKKPEYAIARGLMTMEYRELVRNKPVEKSD
jgi:hypothetical protein